jgi:hypothetical protein
MQTQTNSIPRLIRYSHFFKCNILLVDHLKPSTYRRLIFAFANKRNVAAGDTQYFVIAQDFVNPLFPGFRKTASLEKNQNHHQPNRSNISNYWHDQCNHYRATIN